MSDSESDFDPLNPQLKDDEGWEDVEPDNESIRIVSLFGDETFPDVASMIEDCKQKYHFDFIGTQKRLCLDFYACIKLVNYIRSEVREGHRTPDVSTKELFQDDKYLKPFLEDDALLFTLDEIIDGDVPEQNGVPDATATGQSAGEKVRELQAQLQRLQLEYSEYKETVNKTLDDRWNERATPNSVSPSTGPPEQKKYDRGYFDSYSYNDIHETMLKDTIRTDAYRDFIYDHKHIFAGKTVLDVGCGTGILSMFCARAGAAKVIAVDNSGIIDKARANVFANKLDDKIVCVRGKIEEVTLPVDKVDIIVSEWMGYCLLYEAMLDSVLWARDRYLRPDGLMVPSHCTLQIAPIADPDYLAENVYFWRDVYGFDMKAMMANIHDDVLVRHLSTNNIAARSAPFLQLPLHTITTANLSFTKDFTTHLTEDVDAIDGWVIWFDTFFLPSRDSELPLDARAEEWSKSGQKGVAFTTGPAGKETHWRSGVILIDRSKSYDPRVALKKGDKINGSVRYEKGSENQRELDITVQWDAGDGKDVGQQLWFMR